MSKQQKNCSEPYLTQLKEILLDYDVFSRTAEKLEQMDVKEQHEDWFRTYPLGIQLDTFEFPVNYMITDHIADVYARSVLSTMAFYEEWDWKWDNMPRAERRHCLTEGRAMYEGYAAFRDLRLISRNWAYLANEITFFAGENKIPDSEQKPYFDRFEHADVIELGRSYTGDATYWAIKRNLLLVVDCGIWD